MNKMTKKCQCEQCKKSPWEYSKKFGYTLDSIYIRNIVDPESWPKCPPYDKNHPPIKCDCKGRCWDTGYISEKEWYKTYEKDGYILCEHCGGVPTNWPVDKLPAT